MKGVIFSSLVCCICCFLGACETERDLKLSTPKQLDYTLTGLARTNEKLLIRVTGDKASEPLNIFLQDGKELNELFVKTSTSDQSIQYESKSPLKKGINYNLDIKRSTSSFASSSTFSIPNAPDLYVQKLAPLAGYQSDTAKAYLLQFSFIDSLADRTNYSLKVHFQQYLKGTKKEEVITGLLHSLGMEPGLLVPEQDKLLDFLNQPHYQSDALYYKENKVGQNEYRLQTAFLLPKTEADSSFVRLEFATISDMLYHYYETAYKLGLDGYGTTQFSYLSNPASFQFNLQGVQGIIGAEGFKSYRFKLSQTSP